MKPTAAIILLVLSFFVYCFAFQARRALFSTPEEHLSNTWPSQLVPFVLGLLKRPRRLSLSLWMAQRLSLLSMVLALERSLSWQGTDGALYALVGLSSVALLGRSFFSPRRFSGTSYAFFHTLSRFSWLADRILGPCGETLEGYGKALSRFLLKRKPEAAEEDLTRQELLGLVERGCHEGALESLEHMIIHRVIGFKDRQASKVMTPRTDIFCLPVDMSLNEASTAVREAGYSRVPVYRNNKDDVVGILFAKDLLRLKLPQEGNNLKTLSDLLRPAFFVPVNMELGDLLEQLKERKLHMALCVDEYGALCGLVTMEDILEELFGEIYDEYDLEVRRWEKMGEGNFVVSGKLGLHELEALLGIRIQEEGCNTVAGLVLKKLGRFPLQGEQGELGNLSFRVEKVSPTRILAVNVQVREQKE